MTLREELLKIQEEVRAKYAKQKDKEAASVDGHDVVYRHPSAEQLKDSQINHGIEMEISHYADPMFKPKGYALD